MKLEGLLILEMVISELKIITGVLCSFINQKVLTEQEFARANEKARAEKTELEVRREELSKLVKQAKASDAMVERVPRGIKTFLEAFQGLDIRQQKAQLQVILKAAHIYKDCRIELEFREESSQ